MDTSGTIRNDLSRSSFSIRAQIEYPLHNNNAEGGAAGAKQ